MVPEGSRALEGSLPERTQVLYGSPLKALGGMKPVAWGGTLSEGADRWARRATSLSNSR